MEDSNHQRKNISCIFCFLGTTIVACLFSTPQKRSISNPNPQHLWSYYPPGHLEPKAFPVIFQLIDVGLISHKGQMAGHLKVTSATVFECFLIIFGGCFASVPGFKAVTFLSPTTNLPKVFSFNQRTSFRSRGD